MSSQQLADPSSLELGDERTRGAEEAEQQDAGAVAVPSVFGSRPSSRSRRPSRFSSRTAGREIRFEFVIAKVESTARMTNAKEAAFLRLGRDVAGRDAELHQDERELADLAEVQRRQEARPDALPQRVERRERRQDAAHDREGRDSSASRQHAERRDRDRHAEADEEERDEEVAQARHLGRDVERVREGRERHAGDERAHLARQVQLLGEFAAEEAPGERADEHQFGQRARCERNRCGST